MVTIILLCLLLITCGIIAVRARINDAFEHILPPMHPGELPIIGHAYYLIADTKFAWRLVEKIADNCRQLGGVICGKFGTGLYYLITDPEDAVTVANSCLQKHYVYNFAKDWLGQGLITGSGDVYKRHRKILNPCYAVSVTHGFLEVFNSQARKLVREMDAYSAKGSFDPSPLIKSMALETTCQVDEAIKEDDNVSEVNGQEDITTAEKQPKCREHVKQMTTFGLHINDKNFLHNYMNALNEMMHILTQRFMKFYLHHDFCYKLFGYHKKQDLMLKTLNKMSNEIIQEKKSAVKGGTIERNNNEKSDFGNNEEVRFKSFLDRLIELSIDGLLTDNEIREEADTHIAAAFETTTNTLAHIVVLLGTYPKVQHKMYTELIQVLGTDSDVNKDDLQKLVYTKAVIKESLRVIPTVPVVLRYIDKEVKLKNYTMRANTQCAIFTVGMHRSAVWGPDADQFKPERWLDPASLPTNASCFAGFGLGKRACAGMTYSITLLTVILAHLVRQYKMSGDVSKLELKLDVTLRPTAGHEISIQRRRTNIPPC